MIPTADDQFLTELRRRIASAVFRVCPAWLASHAEDIVQTAMMRVLEAAGKRGEGIPDLSSLYLEKAAFSATVDEIRRYRRRRENQPADSSSMDETVKDQATPEALAASREIRVAIGGCLAALATPRRQAVTLHLQGHSVTEVAALLKWRFKKTENLVYRGFADLRRCLSTKGMAR